MKTMEFKRISPKDIQGNTFSMFAEDLALVTAGNQKSFNTMTIGWGDFGILWSKPIITVYVSSSRYTKQFMDANDEFTVEFFDKKYTDALMYLGTHSGRNEDKVSNARLTPVFTESGNATFKESRLIIEAKKLYSHEFDANALPEEIIQWYKQRKLGLHTMYIGEIKNVWIKQ
ncbi:MAG: flavin reductase family protein [Bacteroidales bacterium]|nr:flavin reductase family protein [Bacteroidales bacterium]